jgi:CRP/FNR family transcriptional regulator, cyclic AMP receptor protein
MFDVAVPRSHVNPPLVELFLNPLLGARRISLHGGASVFEPSHPANSLYFIHRGQVRLYQVGREQSQLIEILGPNDWFGISAIAGASSQGSRGVTVGPAILSEIPVDRFQALLQQHPKAAAELIRSLAQRLRGAREESSRLIFDDCHTRLLKALIRFSHSAAASQSTSGVVLHITHLQLAQAIGVARETVSLALKDLRDQSVLKTGRNQVTFEPQAIESLLQQRLQRPAPVAPAVETAAAPVVAEVAVPEPQTQA